MTQRFTRRGLICGGLAAGLAGVTALPAQAARPPVDVGKVFPFLDRYLKIPPEQRTLYELAYYLTVDGHPAAGVAAWIETPQGRVAVPIGADGRVLRLPTLEMLKAHRKLVLEAPARAKFSMDMELQARLPLGLEVDAAEAARAINQANAGIKVSGGLLGLVTPKMAKTVFLGSGSGRAVMTDGRVVPLPLADGQPAYDPLVLRGARSLRFAKPPSRVLLAPAKA